MASTIHSSHHTDSNSNEQSKYLTNQATPQANHDDDSKQSDEAGAAKAAAAVVVAARTASPQANERRIANETGRNGYREQGKRNIRCLVYSAASWTLPDHSNTTAFVSCMYMLCFQP